MKHKDEFEFLRMKLMRKFYCEIASNSHFNPTLNLAALIEKFADEIYALSKHEEQLYSMVTMDSLRVAATDEFHKFGKKASLGTLDKSNFMPVKESCYCEWCGKTKDTKVCVSLIEEEGSEPSVYCPDCAYDLGVITRTQFEQNLETTICPIQNTTLKSNTPSSNPALISKAT